MKTIKKISTCLFLLITVISSVKAQVKIGNNPNTINTNSILELETTNKGFLPPRVALTAANSPSPLTAPVPTGMIVYSIGGGISDGTYTWDGTNWVAFTLDNSDRTNYVLVKSAADFPAPVGGVITLVAGTFYEVNGTVLVADKINLNGCEIDGLDVVQDKLVYTGSGELFTGSKGGTIEFLSMSAPYGELFNIDAAGAAESILVVNCFFLGCNSIGKIKGLGGYLYFADNGAYANTNGITFESNAYVYLNNAVWDISNTNTYETFTGSCGVIQILGGSRTIGTGNTALNISGITTLVNGSIKATLFLGAGTHVNGTFSNNWEVEAIGLNTEKDDVSTGNLYLTSAATTNFTAINTPKKISGTTASVSLSRVSSTNNRLTYTGSKTRSFLVICSLTGSPAVNNNIFNFYVSKNGIVLPESKQSVKMATTTDQQSVGVSCTVILAPNDFIEVWVENATGTGYIVVSSLNMAIK